MDDAQLQTVWQQRQIRDFTAPIGQPLALLMKHKLAKRVKQLSRLAEVWDEVIPEEIAEHTALEGFNRGTLTVLVDSAPHRFQLNLLLAGGVKKEIQKRFSGTLNHIRLLPGQFYSVDINGSQRYEF